MAHQGLHCQVCLLNFYGIFKFQNHLSSKVHQENMRKLFPNDTLKSPGFFPFIILLNPQTKHLLEQPIIGSSLLTLCFSSDIKAYFYLCHVCERKCDPDEIACHLSSGDHCINYFAYTNPNALSYSWVSSMDVRYIMQPEIDKDAAKNGPGELRMVVLPGNLLKRVEKSTYSEVMHTFGENEALSTLFKVYKPQRVMLDAYQRDSHRLHPLLGMQQIVECVCEGATEKRHYLCALCKQTLPSEVIIQHVLSFDHIFCYFREWHPSTLLSKECYTEYTERFAAAILDFAKQTERIYNTAKANMKQVSLEPAKFTSVNFSCYAEALRELESMTNEKEAASLITPVTPGEKLECRTTPKPEKLWYSLRCQDCSMTFKNIGLYGNHLLSLEHEKMFQDIFGRDKHIEPYAGCASSMSICKYIFKSRKNQPLIGIPLVVLCVCTQTQVEPICICFACKSSFNQSSLMQHFESQKHLVNTLLYQNPWRLPFAWKNNLQVEDLRSLALEEERERGPNQMMLKVFDIPYALMVSLSLDYNQVMESLDQYYTYMIRQVPRCETYSKLKQNERFPVLGNHFLVKHAVYGVPPLYSDAGCLCLLCQKRLSGDESDAHVFSWDHVANFIGRFHPGSLNSTIDAETLLDLAKQAACIHPISNVQEIQLSHHIYEPCTYRKVIRFVASAKSRAGKGQLQPQITTMMKLVPRKTGVDKDSQKSPDSAATTGKISAGAAAEITSAQCVKSAEENGDTKDNPAPNEEESDNNEVHSKPDLEKIKCEEEELHQVVQGREVEEFTEGGPGGGALGSRHNSDKEDKEDVCPNMDVEKKIVSQQLAFKQQQSLEEPQNLPSMKQIHQTAKDEESHFVGCLWEYIKRSSREPVIGLSVLLECNCEQRESIYLCECCSAKIPERNIIGHITRVDHQKMYLTDLQKLPFPPGSNIRQLSVLLEQNYGRGEPQVIEVDEQTHNMISEQDYKSAIQTVKALQAQQDTSVPPQAQHEAPSLMDDHRMVEMEIDEESEAEPSVSVMTERIPKTSESNKDARTTLTQESGSADANNSCLSVSKSAENTSSQQVSSSGRDATRLHPESTGVALKPDVISSSSVGASSPGHTSDTSKQKIEMTSKQTAANTVSSTTPKLKNTSTNSKSKSKPEFMSQTKPLTSAKAMAMSVKCENTASSSKAVLEKKTAGSNSEAAPNRAKNKTPAAPHQTTLKTDNRNPSTEPSQTSENKTKPSQDPLKVGKNQLILVFCEGKRQVYCKLCSVRLQNSCHLTTLSHVFNYVKMKDPVKAGKLQDMESVNKMAAQLAEAEKQKGVQSSQMIKVKSDLYKELAALPEHKALQRVKMMLKHLQVSSTTTANSADDVQVGFGSPCEPSSPHDEIESMSKEEGNLTVCPEGPGFPAVKTQTPQGGAHPLATDSESAGCRPSQTPDTCQQQQTVLDDARRPPPVRTEQHKRPRPDQKAQREPKRCAVTRRLPQISVGEMTQECSHLSRYLKVKQRNSHPVIGLSHVWECRGVSRKSFFMCESCMEMLSPQSICEHMVSVEHQFNYMKIQYPKFLWFLAEDLLPQMKLDILKSVAQKLGIRERYYRSDAQVILLNQDLYEYIGKAPFSEALEMVKSIKRQKELGAHCPPSWAAQQKDHQRPKESLPAERQPAQRSHNETHHLDKTVMVGDLNAGEQRVSTSLDVIGVSSNADSAVSSAPGADTRLSPQEACKSFSTQTEPIPEVEVKQEEEHLDSPFFSLCSLKMSQTQSDPRRHQCSPTRKRPPSPSPETLGPCTKTRRLDDPLPAKQSQISPQPISQLSTESVSESIPEDPAATSTLQPPADKDSGPGPEGKNASVESRKWFEQLLTLVRKRKSEVSLLPSTSAPDDDVKATCGVQGRWDQECVQAAFKRAKIQRWDSKVEVIKATVKKDPPRSDPLDGVVSTATPQVSPGENQPVDSSFSAEYHLIKTIISARQDPCK